MMNEIIGGYLVWSTITLSFMFVLVIFETQSMHQYGHDAWYKIVINHYKRKTLKVWSILCFPILLLVAPAYFLLHFIPIWIIEAGYFICNHVGRLFRKFLMLNVLRREE